jgi:SAM-dependent methyltransferase
LLSYCFPTRALPGSIDERCPDLYLESLGVSEAEKNLIVTLADAPATTIDPVVSVILAATNGILYKHLIGRLTIYPIPRLPLPQGEGKLLLDIGCSWGRWSIAAARNGYKVVGIDPSLGALMAAQRVARSMNIDIICVCADSHHLPFQDSSFDQVYSYSVLQYFGRPNNALAAFAEIGRTLRPGGSELKLAVLRRVDFIAMPSLFLLPPRRRN